MRRIAVSDREELPRVVMQKLGRCMEGLTHGPTQVIAARGFYFVYEDLLKSAGSESEADRIYRAAWMKRYRMGKGEVDEAVRSVYGIFLEGSDSRGTVEKLVSLLERLGITRKDKDGRYVVALSSELLGGGR